MKLLTLLLQLLLLMLLLLLLLLHSTHPPLNCRCFRLHRLGIRG